LPKNPEKSREKLRLPSPVAAFRLAIFVAMIGSTQLSEAIEIYESSTKYDDLNGKQIPLSC